MQTVYYPIKVLDVDSRAIQPIHKIIMILSLGIIVSLFNINNKKKWNAALLIVLICLYFIYLNSFYFAYARYSLIILSIVYIGAAFTIHQIVEKGQEIFMKFIRVIKKKNTY